MCNLEIRLIALYADESPSGVCARYASRARPHSIIQDHLAYVGVGANQVGHEGDGLLGGVDLSDLRGITDLYEVFGVVIVAY